MELDLAFVPAVRDNDGDVADIQCRCGNVEDCDDSEGGADSNEVEAGAKDHDEPDRIDRSVGEVVDFAPESDVVSTEL